VFANTMTDSTFPTVLAKMVSIRSNAVDLQIGINRAVWKRYMLGRDSKEAAIDRRGEATPTVVKSKSPHRPLAKYKRCADSSKDHID
jgi:hypothetical protein